MKKCNLYQTEDSMYQSSFSHFALLSICANLCDRNCQYIANISLLLKVSLLSFSSIIVIISYIKLVFWIKNCVSDLVKHGVERLAHVFISLGHATCSSGFIQISSVQYQIVSYFQNVFDVPKKFKKHQKYSCLDVKCVTFVLGTWNALIATCGHIL